MVSILAPLAYVAFLVGSLMIFSRVYRRRQATKKKMDPWFPAHHTRDIYVSLLSMEPPAARPILIAALLRRAMTDVSRIMVVRDSKNALQTLLAKGQIGDDTWNHLLETEKELEAELMEVVGEANTWRQGWGQIIFAHANDMVQHEKHQKVWREIESEKERLRTLYSQPAPAIQAPPILGISASNPKKRTLPASVPTNASNVPSLSKPGTPAPAAQQAGGPNGSGGIPPLQPGQQPTPQQMQAILQARAQAQQQAMMMAQMQQQQQQQQQQQNGTPGTPSKQAASNGAAPKSASPQRTTSTGSERTGPSITAIADDSSEDEGEGGSAAGSGTASPQQTKSGQSSAAATPSKKKKNKKKGKK